VPEAVARDAEDGGRLDRAQLELQRAARVDRQRAAELARPDLARRVLAALAIGLHDDQPAGTDQHERVLGLPEAGHLVREELALERHRRDQRLLDLVESVQQLEAAEEMLHGRELPLDELVHPDRLGRAEVGEAQAREVAARFRTGVARAPDHLGVEADRLAAALVFEGEAQLLADRKRLRPAHAGAGGREVAELAEDARPALLVEDADVDAQADPFRRAPAEGGEQVLGHVGDRPIRGIPVLPSSGPRRARKKPVRRPLYFGGPRSERKALLR
jgi:hypothetical protein